MTNVKTIKQLIAASNIPASLIRSAIKQFGGWNDFKEIAEDVYRHGIDGGFSGFIYYKDTVAFTKRNKKTIIEYAGQLANDCDYNGIIDFLSCFGCLKGETQEEIADGLYNPQSDNQTRIYNALAWFAAEEVCRAYCEANDE